MFSGGVWLKVTSRVEYQVQVLWGVNISKLYPATFQSWDQFIAAVEGNRFPGRFLSPTRTDNKVSTLYVLSEMNINYASEKNWHQILALQYS